MPKDTPDAPFDSGLDFDRYVHSPGGIGRRSRSPERPDPTGTETSSVPAGTTTVGPVRPSWLPATTPVPAGNPRTWRLGGAAVSLTMGLVATGVGLHIALGAVGVSPVVPPSDDGPGVVEEVDAAPAASNTAPPGQDPAAVPMPVEEVHMDVDVEDMPVPEAAAAETAAPIEETAAPETAAPVQEVAPQEVAPQEVAPQEMAPQEMAPQEMAPQEMMSAAENMGPAGTGMNR